MYFKFYIFLKECALIPFYFLLPEQKTHQSTDLTFTDERVKASSALPGSSYKFQGNKKEFLGHLRKALYASKLISYAQGFMLLREAAVVSENIVFFLIYFINWYIIAGLQITFFQFFFIYNFTYNYI